MYKFAVLAFALCVAIVYSQTSCSTDQDCHPSPCHDAHVASCNSDTKQCECDGGNNHQDNHNNNDHHNNHNNHNNHEPAVGKRATSCSADHDCHPPVCGNSHHGVCQNGQCDCDAAHGHQQSHFHIRAHSANCTSDDECVTLCGKDHAKCHHDNMCHCDIH
ncbi:transcriptional repressor NF-X1 homolog [Aplysia californica]|uniref:Transcriptional repressor NF-X1 homolog n=1 Tax=Aplysia californica TaxID=6500 RepID=A0ABM0JJV6_APLCA|nr:transcriptional repressor NF-X1 homolog [Aplysia californica]